MLEYCSQRRKYVRVWGYYYLISMAGVRIDQVMWWGGPTSNAEVAVTCTVNTLRTIEIQ